MNQRPGTFDKIIFASSNKTKLAEVRYIFERKYGVTEILSLEDVGLNITCEEIGQTYADNSAFKAFNIYSQLEYDNKLIPVLADDSGYEFAQWPDALGLYTARQLDKYPVEKLDMNGDLSVTQCSALTLIYTQKSNNHYANVKMSQAFYTVKGLAINVTKGDYGSYYMNSFIPLGETRTFGELGIDYICNESARALALQYLINNDIVKND